MDNEEFPVEGFDEDALLEDLSDDELEKELTIAASNPKLEDRYEMLLAERARRHPES